jgi:FtsH-binding integral membrane protein
MVYERYEVHSRASCSMYQVYGWMAGALSLTAAVAYYIARSPAIFETIFKNPAYVAAIVIMQLGLVLAITFLLHRMSFVTALILFATYAVSMGVTMSAILFAYQSSSVYAAFLVTAGMFTAMALYGYFTEADLTSIGSIGIMVLFGMILAMVINMFLQSPGMAYVISAVGVVVFSLLIAYDTQKIKEISRRYMMEREMAHKVALFGALTLYLDFINLFISLLQFMGKRRQD